MESKDKDKEILRLQSEVRKGNMIMQNLQQKIGDLYGLIAMLEVDKHVLLAAIPKNEDKEE